MRKSFLRPVVAFVMLVAVAIFSAPSAADAAASSTIWGLYQIIGTQSNKCIADPNASPNNGVTMIIWPCHDPMTSEQQFWAEDHGGNDWELWNNGNGKCLTVLNASTENNAPVIQYDCTLGANEVWRINGTNHRIVNKKSGLCLTVKNASTDNGTALLQFTCNGGANQEWTFRSAP
ncbi:RICIN domain-containing protein [Cryptosporangium sp. NPDC051539]|uniref:RICIN domain-containing protein n=1 Tax=Cryptosporangium sp. NPDC051539 TaxID=3363962 RepID=UPI00378D07BC